MAVIKCKSCGKEVTSPENAGNGFCQHCGSPVTLDNPAANPAVDFSRSRSFQMAQRFADEESKANFAAGEDEKHLNLEQKLSKEMMCLLGIVFTIIIIMLLLIPAFIKKHNLSNGDVCKIEKNVVVGVRYEKAYITEVVIPDGVSKIGSDAFWGCTSLTSVTIPHGVHKIERDAFSGCTSLTSVDIPDSVTYIGGGAFSGCTSLTSLTSVKIPDSVTYIGDGAFSGCKSLKKVRVPQHCRIGDNAFPDHCKVIWY